MNSILTKIMRTGFTVALLATARLAMAQAAVESTTTTTTAGTITEFDPHTIVVRSRSEAEPMRYRYTKSTTYVDEAGNPVSIETVKSGLPVTVYYDREGGDMVARKVVVRREVATTAPAAPAVERQTTTTMTAGGTVSAFDPNDIVIRSESASEPTRYRYTKSTTYVDEGGQPVSVETVKSGVPVTVYYDREGDDMVARKVVVRKAEVAPGTVIEHRKTTTTEEK